MSNGSPIIAGIDFSASSSVVLDHGVKMALAGGRPLIAAHVLDDSRLKDWSDATGLEFSIERLKEEAGERLAGLAAAHAGSLPVSHEILIGKPYLQLAGLVKREHAGLLILNAHDLSKKRLGTVTARCVREVPADLLVLRDWQGRLFHKIAVCIDFSDTSAKALDRAIDEASAHGASLEIIHVLFPPARDPWGRMMDQRMDAEDDYEVAVRSRVQERLAAFCAPFAERLGRVQNKTTLLESEDPAACIAAHVSSDQIDLTVLGTQGRSWLGGLILGSTAERLLHDSPSSVLLVRAE